MSSLRTTAALAVLFAACAASAQVFKCQDAAGKTIYSDAPCSTSQTGQQLERRRTFEEKMQEREQAHEAQMTKEERRAREEERERVEAERRATAAAAQPKAPPHKGYAERLAERNAGVRSTLTGPASSLPPRRKNTAMPTPPPAPSVITHCGGGVCHDNLGGVYQQHGNGTTMTGPSGSTCIQTGGMVQCP